MRIRYTCTSIAFTNASNFDGCSVDERDFLAYKISIFQDFRISRSQDLKISRFQRFSDAD